MGYALAEAALAREWEVDLVSGPVALPEPPGARMHPVLTGREMQEKIEALFETCHLLIMTAAVMDYRPLTYSAHKLKKTGGKLVVELEPVADILKGVAARKSSQLVVGFAAETDHVEAYARKKLQEKNCDFIVANRVGKAGEGFGSDNNCVILISREGKAVNIGPDTKSNIAHQLLDHFSRVLAGLELERV